MSRKLRMEVPGAFWHVYNRGVNGADIFLDEKDRRVFLAIFEEAAAQWRWRVASYCQMTNHYHALVHTPYATLSSGMKKLDGEYAMYINKRHNRYGHLFQDRFCSQLVDAETYLLRVARYIVLNPVRAGMVTDPLGWRWSSFGMTAGQAPLRPLLDPALILDRFDRSDIHAAMAGYQAFVRASPPESNLWAEVRDGRFLGPDEFVDTMKARLEASREVASPDLADPATARDVVEEVFRMKIRPASVENQLARIAYGAAAREEALASTATVARTLRISESTARELPRRSRILERNNPDYANRLQEVRRRLRSCP